MRCLKCGIYRSTFEETRESCVKFEHGTGNSASPSGAYPVPNGEHLWRRTDPSPTLFAFQEKWRAQLAES